MDAKTRYSVGGLVSSTSLKDTTNVVECTWILEFWPPASMQGDHAFNNAEFPNYIKLYDIQFRSAPRRSHSKNVLQSKHRILRDVFLRIESHDETGDPRTLVSKMFRIYNNLYSNDIATSHEIAKGYILPVITETPHALPASHCAAHDELIAKRKPNMIISSRAI